MRTPTYFSRAPITRSTRPRHEDATGSPAPESDQFRFRRQRTVAALCDRTLQDRVMSSKSPSTAEHLLDELQATLAHGTVAQRVATLRRVTDLFIRGAGDFCAP